MSLGTHAVAHTKATRRHRATNLALAAIAAAMLGALVWWFVPWKFGTTQVAAPTVKVEDHPTIAVLPFENISGDEEQVYFSDGITDDLINDLSKIAGLNVIARNSTFAYQGSARDVRQIGIDLDAQFAVEGSVRRISDRVRINVQLIDAATGKNIWAERYDREFRDIFELQDQVTEDYRSVGLSLRAHPLSFQRDGLDQLRVTRCAGLADPNP